MADSGLFIKSVWEIKLSLERPSWGFTDSVWPYFQIQDVAYDLFCNLTVDNISWVEIKSVSPTEFKLSSIV